MRRATMCVRVVSLLCERGRRDAHALRLSRAAAVCHASAARYGLRRVWCRRCTFALASRRDYTQGCHWSGRRGREYVCVRAWVVDDDWTFGRDGEGRSGQTDAACHRAAALLYKDEGSGYVRLLQTDNVDICTRGACKRSAGPERLTISGSVYTILWICDFTGTRVESAARDEDPRETADGRAHIGPGPARYRVGAVYRRRGSWGEEPAAAEAWTHGRRTDARTQPGTTTTQKVQSGARVHRAATMRVLRLAPPGATDRPIAEPITRLIAARGRSLTSGP